MILWGQGLGLGGVANWLVSVAPYVVRLARPGSYLDFEKKKAVAAARRLCRGLIQLGAGGSPGRNYTCLHDYTLIEFAKCITLFCNSSKILMTGYLVLFLTNKLIESDHIWASIWSLFILFNIFSMLERVLNFALCFCSLPARLLVALCGLRDCILNTMLQHAVISFINQKKNF